MVKNQKGCYIIAIDGPSATGKSNTAKLLSKKLNIMYLDTGAMYRAVAYFFISNNLVINEENVKRFIDKINIDISCVNNNTKVILNGDDITGKIRQNEISMCASDVSKFAVVREMLVDMQQKIGKNISLVLEGRDTTSVVFPNADLKIYLDANSDVRTKRRKNDLDKLGQNLTLSKVKEDLEKRDFQDMNRNNSPLIKVKDAILLDTTYMSIEQVVDYIIKLLKEKSII